MEHQANHPTDEGILHRVRALVEEEHRLREGLQSGDVDGGSERSRVQQIEEELDQCWDLLRQRRARREFGQESESAEPRSVGTVEGYLQ
jgi:hypothetical protein